MALQLNDPGSEKYEEFYGANINQMPLLTGEGRTPLSAVDLMSRYLEVLDLHKNAPKELKPAYASLLRAWGDNFDLGDGAARHSDGRMKVEPDANYLRLLTPKTRLVNGAVDLSEGYEALTGEEFGKAQVDKYCGVSLSRSDAKSNPVWLALARGDKSLLSEFVDARFARAKERFHYDGKMMGVHAPAVPKEGAAGRLWFVDRFIYYSRAIGYNHLVNYDGRLVGVAPEAQRAASRALEQRV